MIVATDIFTIDRKDRLNSKVAFTRDTDSDHAKILGLAPLKGECPTLLKVGLTG